MTITKEPTWKLKALKSYPQLKGNIEADNLIIGGGLAGLTTAYFLAKEGKSVVVVEKDKVASGVTPFTTAFITQDIDTEASKLITMYGQEVASMVYKAGQFAIDTIEKIIDTEKIDCEFTRSNLYTYAKDEKEYKYLKEEQEAYKQLGVKTQLAEDVKLNFNNSGYLTMPDQAKFHPIKFLHGLLKVLESMDVKIYEKTEITEIEDNHGKVDVKFEGGNIKAWHVVMATYQPFYNPIQLFLKKGMYVSYVFEAKIEKGILKEGLYQDLHNPYHYFRVDPQDDFDRVIVGGEDHRKEIKMDNSKNYKALEEYFSEVMNGNNYSITRKWTGPILEPSDGLALIGEYQPNQYVATAFSGNGMTYSIIAAAINCDLILGHDNQFAHVFDPKRIPSIKQLTKKAADYTGELFGGALKNIITEI